MKAFRSISVQIMLAVLLTVISVLAVSSIIELSGLKQRETRRLQDKGSLTADRMANSLAYPLWNLNLEETEQIVLDELGSTDIFRIQVFDEDGSLYLGKVRGTDGAIRNVDGANQNAPTSANATLYSFSKEVNFKNTRIGSVTLEVTDANLQAELASQRREIAIKLLLLIAALSVVLLLALRVLVIRPISTLKTWVANIPSGKGAQPPRFKLSGEVNSLAEAFSEMSAKLREKNAELESEQQRLQELNRQMQAEIEERKRTEEALRASEERFVKIFNLSPIRMGLIRLKDGIVLQVNDTWVRETGFSREEIINHPIFELSSWLDDEMMARIRQWLASGKPVLSFEGRLTTRAGGERYVLTSTEVVELDNEPCFIWASNDITERRQMDEALKANETLLRQFIKHTPAAIAMFDMKMRYLQTSDRWLTAYHLERQNIIGQRHYDVFPDLPDRWKEAHARVLAGAIERCDEDPHQLPDGTMEWLQWEAIPWRKAGGEIGGMILFTQVITERKRAEEALQASERRFSIAFNSNPVPAAITTLENGHFLAVNDQFVSLTGYSRDEVIGHTSQELSLATSSVNRAKAIERMEREGQIRDFERHLRLKSGEERTMLFSIEKIELEGQSCLLQVAIDITERRRAEEQNRQLIHDLGERVKELTALHHTARLLQDEDKSIPELLRNIVSLLPPAWQYPEVTAARISFGEMEFKTPNFAQTRWSQVAQFTAGTLKGAIEVLYLEEQPEEDMGPFLFEERNLIDSLAEMISSALNRRFTQEALRTSEERFAKAFQASPEPISIYRHRDGTLQEINERWTAIYGYTREEALGHTSLELKLVTPEVRQRLRRVLEEQGPVRGFEIEFQTKQGEVRHVSLAAEQIVINNEPCDIFLHHDITERRQAEEELRTSREQLRALSESLRRAKEEEGIRIARELHDELGAALTSLKWSLMRLDKGYSADMNAANDGDAHTKIEEMVALVDATINTVRRISSELRPGVLDDLGLVSAIEWHAHQFQANTGILCRFDSLIEQVDLSREQATTVFRIFQEAMTNILRHAQATKVKILIEEEEDEFVLEVNDNGRGITESEKLGTRSLGLLGMRERAHSIDGRVEINGTVGKGTTLIVRLPIQANSTV